MKIIKHGQINIIRNGIVVLLGILAVFSVEAKDMSNRLGVGIKNSFFVDLPSVAAHYSPNKEIGFTGALGIDTQDDNSKFGIQGGVRKLIFEEKNLNFFMGGQLSLISVETAGSSASGFELNGLCGVEFYFSELENLGFNVDFGVGVVSIKDGNKVRTIANDPIHAGIIFYF